VNLSCQNNEKCRNLSQSLAKEYLARVSLLLMEDCKLSCQNFENADIANSFLAKGNLARGFPACCEKL